MKVLTAALGLLFFTIAAEAQGPAILSTDVFRYPLNRETTEAFKATCAALAENPVVRGNFEQEKIISRLNRSLKSSGNFIITSELGMVWETLKPFPSTLVLGKDYLVQGRPGGQKTVLNAAGNETFIRFAEVISAVFSGQTEGLLENFDVFYKGVPAAWELGLLPHDKAISSFAGSISLAGGDAIRIIVIHEQNGDAIIYNMSNHEYSSRLNAHEKTFFQIP